jgi:outer membrane protein OmpU
MKKILLATTILGMTAGFAAADVSFKGTGTVGFATNGTGGPVGAKGKTATANGKNGVTSATVADDKTEVYSSFKLSVSASGETDSGLTFGASSSITAGVTYAMADDDGFEVGKGTLGTPTLFIAGEFGKIQFKSNGFKEFQDDNAEKYDVDYAGTFGGLSVGVRSDLNTVVGNGTYNAATAGKSSISLGYTVSDITLGALYDEVGGKYGISASRAFGPITGKLTAEGSTAGTTVTSLKLSYAADAITASILAKSNNAWEVEAGYAANGISVAAKTTDLSKWKVTAAYDLGGGLSLEAGTNYTNDMFVGAKMAF